MLKARFLELLLLGCLLLLLVLLVLLLGKRRLLVLLLDRRRFDVLLLGKRRHQTLFVLLLLLFLSKQKREALLFLELLQDMLCKTALALCMHAQDQVRRHNALTQARVEVVRLLLHAVLFHLGRFIALSEPVGTHHAQGLGRKRLLTKGSAFASDIFC